MIMSCMSGAVTHTLGEALVAPDPPSVINRPRQIAQAASISRNGHNTLRDQMNLTVDEFNEFVDLIDESTDLHLDVSLPWKQQSPGSKTAHINWVAREWGLASNYTGNWPIEAYTIKHAKLASRQASTPKYIPGGKKGSPQRKSHSTRVSPAKITRPKSRMIYVGRRPPVLGRAPSRSLTPEAIL
ncbi:hypothetical protein DAEQUDRAFT_340714 [Daedalea quercina L-15889]|uniref:Uncharacterized protein n=1 Tax=Daedalea quercina L-15889 TaxID=1314783 RepID=A0A165PF43_9APHY|nr:hypothetical protein DAEQUDRAFT_340714 [Daedalea quercina L-15889]